MILEGTMHRSLRTFFRRNGTKDGEKRTSETDSLEASSAAGETIRTWTTKGSGRTTTHNTALTEPLPSSAEALDLESEPPLGIKVLIPQSAEDANCVDIIAIHGLNGHREKTWVDKTTRLNWLSHPECLPKDIPTARVLTFGYNSRNYFSKSTSDVRDFASELLAATKANRKSEVEQSRPIIFLCHSLGGLVFKQAIIRAHEQDDHYASIVNCTAGVVFFATPHRGSDLAFWDQLGTTLVRVGTFGYSTNPKLSKSLRVDSTMLKMISESFPRRGGHFKIRSFYETERMPGLNCLVVEKDSATLGWPNELDTAVSANHSTICKFASSSDQRYQITMFAITELVNGLFLNKGDGKYYSLHPRRCGVPEYDLAMDPGEATNSEDPPFDLREQSCMRDLNSDYEGHLGQVDDPVPNTCQWVLSHPQWHRWESLSTSALLWITADAGCGKSVIAKFLVNHFISSNHPSSKMSLAYFFFKEGLEDQDNASAAVSAIIHQLCCTQRRLIHHVMAKYTSTPKKKFNRFSSLWSILIAIINDPVRNNIIWVLDGLDECEKKSLDDLIKAVATYMDSISSMKRQPRPYFKVIALSRPHNFIQKRLRLADKGDIGDTMIEPESSCYRKMRLSAEEESASIAKDITLFVRSKISEFAKDSELLPGILSRLEERLIKGADYTFLWISLVIKLVEDTEVDGISMIQLESILNTTRLDDVYERLLSGRTLPLKTRKALMIVLAAVRPITVKEMCAAIEVHQDHFDDSESQLKLQELSGAGISAMPEVMAETTEKMTAPAGKMPKASNPFIAAESPTAVPNLDMLEKLLHKPFSNHLRQICGHFLRIRGRKVYLVHQTAREFLLSNAPLSSLYTHRLSATPDAFDGVKLKIKTPIKWRHSIHIWEASLCMLQICVDTIKLFRSERFMVKSSQRTTKEVVEYLKACRDDPARAFFKYATFHWVDHYRPMRAYLELSFDYLLKPSNSLFNVWILVHRNWIPKEERNRLEIGGVPIGRVLDEEQIKEDSKYYSGQGFYSPIKQKKRKEEWNLDTILERKKPSEMEEAESKTDDFEMVLEYFNLNNDEFTKIYDAQFLDGHRYWKNHNEKEQGEDDDDNQDNEDLESNGDDATDSWQIPDRVQFYRRQKRDEVVEWFNDMSNPMSPVGGNPSNSSRMNTYLYTLQNPLQ